MNYLQKKRPAGKKRPATLSEKGPNIAKFIRTPILKIICERLFLKISMSMTNFPKEGNF